MNKALKYALIAVAAIVVLFALLLVGIALTVNPNKYKPQIIELVKEKKQRTLTLEGDIKLALFPKLGIDLGKGSISEHNGTAEFAAINNVRLSVAWLPLLHKELVVDHVAVDGVRANLVRYKDGSTNFDDLLSKEKDESQQVKFDIDSIKISDASLKFDDRKEGRTLAIDKLNAKTGRIRNATPTDVELEFDVQSSKPKLATHVQLSSGLTFDLDKKRYALDGLKLNTKGDALGITGLDVSLQGDLDARPQETYFVAKDLKGELKGKRGADVLEAKLDAPGLELTKDKVTSAKLVLEAKVQQPDGSLNLNLALPSLEGSGKAFKTSQITLDVDGKQGENAIKGKLTTPFSGNLESQQFVLGKIAASLEAANPKLPKGKMSLSIAGDANVDLKQGKLAANLATKLDESNIKAKLGMANFAKPFYTFDIGIDQIDADRYLKAEEKPKKDEPEKPFDLSALKTLNASGSLRIGSLKYANIKSTNVRLDLKASDGTVNVNPLSANLYQGTMNGALTLHATATPQVAVRQNLSGISIGPLLRDAANKDMLEGKGNVALDVTSQGNTVSAMKRALNGSASLNLRDGAIKGIDIAATLRNAKAKLGQLRGEQVQEANQTQKTDFSELKASFNIRNGVAHNNDLSMKSPLLRLGGEGDVNIGANSMDYLAKATVVGTLEGQGGAELGSLKGITVPVRISGPFDGLRYKLDFNALASEAVKQKVEQKKEEIKGKVQEQLQDKLKGLFGR
jgi:AsmA protein